jgi:hypothetical protein
MGLQILEFFVLQGFFDILVGIARARFLAN